MVKGREFPLEVRKEIVRLHMKGLNTVEIAKLTGIAGSTVSYILKKYRSTGVLTSNGRSGRPKTTTNEEDMRMLALRKSSLNLNLTQITKIINNSREKPLDVTTVRRRILILEAKLNNSSGKQHGGDDEISSKEHYQQLELKGGQEEGEYKQWMKEQKQHDKRTIVNNSSVKKQKLKEEESQENINVLKKLDKSCSSPLSATGEEAAAVKNLHKLIYGKNEETLLTDLLSASLPISVETIIKKSLNDDKFTDAKRNKIDNKLVKQIKRKRKEYKFRFGFNKIFKRKLKKRTTTTIQKKSNINSKIAQGISEEESTKLEEKNNSTNKFPSPELIKKSRNNKTRQSEKENILSSPECRNISLGTTTNLSQNSIIVEDEEDDDVIFVLETRRTL